jgi:hypothetical protein
MLVNDEYGSLTFIRVVLIFSVGSKSFDTIAAEALVEYMNSVYFGFARNVSEPFVPSSILDILNISTSRSPTIVPLI